MQISYGFEKGDAVLRWPLSDSGRLAGAFNHAGGTRGCFHRRVPHSVISQARPTPIMLASRAHGVTAGGRVDNSKLLRRRSASE
jgi:hypothetical protein